LSATSRITACAVALVSVLTLISVWDQHRELDWIKCLKPYPEWSKRMPTWSGTPFFSPRCDQPQPPPPADINGGSIPMSRPTYDHPQTLKGGGRPTSKT
jgi:hypothetical protein